MSGSRARTAIETSSAIMALCGVVSVSGCKHADRPDGAIAIPAGTFTMGCVRSQDPDCAPTEEPAHALFVAGYLIDRTEVTASRYQACVDAHACSPATGCGDVARDPRLPVTCVDWDQASRFCRWQGGALPTEAQWEKAARGTDARRYPWGNDEPTCERAAFAECVQVPLAVGTHPRGASPYGVLDMAGNVAEWVDDAYVPYGAATPGVGRVVRDDASDAWHMRATTRNYLVPTYRSATLGFRCAYPPAD